MTSESTILLGVVSGLLSGYAIYFLAVVFRRVVVPWYAQFIYRGIDISGTWLLNSDSYDRRTITLELKQRAGELSGLSTHVLREGSPNSDSSDSDRIRTYHIVGNLHDRFVILTGRPTQSTRIGALCFLLEIVGDGTTMMGVGTAYSSSLKRIDSRTFVVRRLGDTSTASRSVVPG
jgi:hypothetical protein